MEQENSVAGQPPAAPSQDRRIRKRTFSLLSLIVAIILTLYGLYEMYHYGGEDKIVGGDAYNFIIMAGRGTGWICSGIVSALIAVVLAIFDMTDKQQR